MNLTSFVSCIFSCYCMHPLIYYAASHSPLFLTYHIQYCHIPDQNTLFVISDLQLESTVESHYQSCFAIKDGIICYFFCQTYVC